MYVNKGKYVVFFFLIWLVSFGVSFFFFFGQRTNQERNDSQEITMQNV